MQAGSVEASDLGRVTHEVAFPDNQDAPAGAGCRVDLIDLEADDGVVHGSVQLGAGGSTEHDRVAGQPVVDGKCRREGVDRDDHPADLGAGEQCVALKLGDGVQRRRPLHAAHPITPECAATGTFVPGVRTLRGSWTTATGPGAMCSATTAPCSRWWGA